MECPPKTFGSNAWFANRIREALKTASLAEREKGTLENLRSIVIRQDGDVISAELWDGESDWYQFQLVLNDSVNQSIGSIVG